MNTIPEKYLVHIEMIVSAARDFLSKGEELQGMAFLGKFGLGVVPIPVNMADKDRSAMMVQAICKEAKPDFVMMISEAWAVEQKDGVSAVKICSLESLADHPDRMDIIMLTLETREGLWFGKSEIKPSGDGKRGFGDLQFDFSKEFEGRFSHFLPREGPTH